MCEASRERSLTDLVRFSSPPSLSSTIAGRISGDAVPRSCARSRKAYESACPASWVVHFDQTHAHNKAVSQFLEQKVKSGKRTEAG